MKRPCWSTKALSHPLGKGFCDRVARTRRGSITAETTYLTRPSRTTGAKMAKTGGMRMGGRRMRPILGALVRST